MGIFLATRDASLAAALGDRESRMQVVIIGGGPAGLSAGYELVRRGIKPVVLEAGDRVGGISRTEAYNGFRFDIGGHRFYTKIEEVDRIWHEVLEEGFLEVPRLSRIHYRGRFIKYPLEPLDTLTKVGATEGARMILSYLAAKARPETQEETLEEWVINRFGRRLYSAFFKSYTEKVWGVPCDQIRAEWAAQRIKGLSVRSLVSNALFGTNGSKSLIERFNYPSLGPGMMWEAVKADIERAGGVVHLKTEAVGLKRRGSRLVSVTAAFGGETVELPADHVISSAALPDLVARLDPAAPAAVGSAARDLSFRALIVVGLIVRRAEVFPDNWIYVHTPSVRVGRIQNFKNWSLAMVPDPSMTSLGMEYFCSEGDEIWRMTDRELVRLASREIAALGLADAAEVEDATVIRQPKAYPVYDADYRSRLATVREFVDSLENLQTIGRNGMHRYNNQDHSMLTGLLSARNILGDRHDLWTVNTERSYYEDFRS
jgi:protoporphyrinogen oxidase